MLEICWFANLGTCQIKSETGPHICRQGETAERQNHYRLGGGRFNEQGNLPYRLACVAARYSRSLHLPARILRLYGGYS